MGYDDPYATVEDYGARFSDAGSDDGVRLREELLNTSRYIDSQCHQFFWNAVQTRTYIVPHTSAKLRIDNLVSATSVKIDTDSDGDFADESAITAYVLSRDGDLNAALEGKPYNTIALRTSQFVYGQRVQVAGTFGWSAVPPEVKRACVELTGIYRIESPRSTVSIDQMGTVVSMSPQARGFIQDCLHAVGWMPVFA